MILDGGRIEMTASEFEAFAAATFAPWKPRTVAEFNAMCNLGAARHLAENTGGAGFMHALEAEGMLFGEDGTANFPMDQRKMDFVKKHGTWPTAEEFKTFLAAGDVAAAPPKLALVKPRHAIKKAP